MPPLQRCEKGHYFQPARHPQCPVCLTVQSNPSGGQPAPVPAKTGSQELFGPTNRPVGWLVVKGGPSQGQDACLVGGPETGSVWLDRLGVRWLDIGRDRPGTCTFGLFLKGEGPDEIHTASLRVDPNQDLCQLDACLVKTLVRVNGEVVDPGSPVSLANYDVIEIGPSELVFVPLCGPKFRWPVEVKPLPRVDLSKVPDRPVVSSGAAVAAELPKPKKDPVVVATEQPVVVAAAPKPNESSEQPVAAAPEPSQSGDAEQALIIWLGNKRQDSAALEALARSGFDMLRAARALEQAKEKRRQSNRELGTQRVIGGLLSLCAGGVLTYMGNRVFVSLLAAGLVFTLVGFVQATTGAEIS